MRGRDRARIGSRVRGGVMKRKEEGEGMHYRKTLWKREVPCWRGVRGSDGRGKVCRVDARMIVRAHSIQRAASHLLIDYWVVMETKTASLANVDIVLGPSFVTRVPNFGPPCH